MAPPDRQWMKYFDAETITRLSHLGFQPTGLVEGHLVGDHRSPFHGFAIEFAGHRQYVPGDDLRHLDWRAHARTQKLLVKQYEQETNLNAHVVVDVSSSMSFEHKHGRKIDYAAFVAVALSQVIINQSDSVGAHLFDDRLRTTIDVSSSQDVVAKISECLAEAELKRPSSIGEVLRLAAERLGRRQVVFVVSDFFADPEATFEGVRRLLDDHHEVVLFQVVDPLEATFNIPGRVRLLELEGERRLDIVGHNIRDSYRELFQAFLDDMAARSLGLGIDHVLCVTDKPFGVRLAEYLSRRLLRK